METVNQILMLIAGFAFALIVLDAIRRSSRRHDD